MYRLDQASMPRGGLDELFGPPPMEYPYHCMVCGTEVLVNEAIIDAGIGMAKCRNEYHEGFSQPLAVRDVMAKPWCTLIKTKSSPAGR